MSQSSAAIAPEKRRVRWLMRLLFALSQIIAFFVIVEFGARLLDPLGISYYPETARLLDQMILEEPIGYRLPPGLEGRYHGVDVRINALGMRDRPVASQKEPGEFRILVMGDSVMFSIGVEYEESIPFQIERIANEGAPPGRRYRTLNMGVPSYNTEQQLIQLEELGLSLQPDAAVLLLVPNDLEPKMWVFEKRSNMAADLSQRSYAASLIYFLSRSLAERLTQTLLPQSGAEDWVRGVGHGDSRSNLRIDVVATALAAISQRLQSVGAPFLLIYHNRVSDELVDVIREVGAREGFAVSRLHPWGDSRWQNESPSDYRNSEVDAHCNARGCEINAVFIHERMVEAGLFD